MTGGILPAATWAKYMRVAMAYEKPIALPGLPPPIDTGEQLIADTAGGENGFDPGASGRLAIETSDALGRLEQRFRKATAETPVRQAALSPGATASP